MGNSPTAAFKAAVLRQDYERALELVNPQVACASYRYKRFGTSTDKAYGPSLIFLVDNHVARGLWADSAVPKKVDAEKLMRIAAFSKVFLALVMAGAEVNVVGGLNTTPLHVAAKLNLIEVTEELIKRGADVNATDIFQKTPIFQACKGGSYEAFDLLRRAKDVRFDVNGTDNAGTTLLLAAVVAQNSKIVQFLLDNGANVRLGNVIGSTPLCISAGVGDLETMRLLLAGDANTINAKDDHGNTPLHFAVAGGKPEAIKLLLECGADPTITNRNNKTPLQVAMTEGHAELAPVFHDFAASGTNRT